MTGGGGGGNSATLSGALLAQAATTAHSAAIPAKRITRIAFLPACSSGSKNQIAAVNRD
jgi:hypothetical protein